VRSTILLVEDDPGDASPVRAALSAEGVHDIIGVETLEDARIELATRR
jgi:hypothetical protein